MIRLYLEDLENRIIPEVEEELLSQWKGFLDGKVNSPFFSPRRKILSPPSFPWRAVLINEAIDDFDLMALQQISECSATLASGSGAIMNVRPNYGAGTFPSVFGADIFIMDTEFNALPTSKPLNGGIDDVMRILDRGAPDIHTGYGERCLAMGERFAHLFADYPKVSKYVRIYHPDLQCPMDVCELLLGSNLMINAFWMNLMGAPSISAEGETTISIAFLK
ncbi:hypothetical protein JW926_07240 [Candidatus Sumerlaeota bacterium]|nr:hypothetical protein [Candidatus Sumerlaeota bacterium]